MPDLSRPRDSTKDNAKDLGVLNIASALPFAIAPTIAQAILAIGS